MSDADPPGSGGTTIPDAGNKDTLGSGGKTGSGGAGSGGKSGSGGAGGVGGKSGSGGSGSGGKPGSGGSGSGGKPGSGGSGAGGGVGGTTGYSAGSPDTNEQVKNACTDGGSVSFICPRFMLFSPEMNQAAIDDATAKGWPAGSFNYGVVTLNGAPCCSCFQIVFDKPQNNTISYSAPKPLIAQNFNMGGANGAFDIFMGKGGQGAQTGGCSKQYSGWPSTGEPNGGGIRASNFSECGKSDSTLASAGCKSAVASACNQLQSSSSYLTSVTRNSCIVANSAGTLYHENWNVKARRVTCPTALTQVTGCRPNAGSDPQPDPTIQTAAQASGWQSYGTTTMQDCCKPSCSWPSNVSNVQSPWSAMYQCRADGSPMTK